MFQVLLKKLGPIFFVIALDYFAGRRRTIENHHVRDINALVMELNDVVDPAEAGSTVIASNVFSIVTLAIGIATLYLQ